MNVNDAVMYENGRKDERATIVVFLRKYAADALPKTENPTNEQDVLDAMLAGTVQAIAKSIEEGAHRE